MVKVRKTKKSSKTTKSAPMTVPELRRAFHHIHTLSHKSVSVAEFRKEWKKVFGTELTQKVASEYLDFVKQSKHSQKGGAYSPAPIGYDMGPGLTTAGPSVPAYVAGGFPLPSDSIAASCGKNPFLPPAESMGSNAFTAQKGGKRTRKAKKQRGGALPTIQTAFYEFLQRPFAMASPPLMRNDMMLLPKGYNEFSSPRPETNNITIPNPPVVYNMSTGSNRYAFP